MSELTNAEVPLFAQLRLHNQCRRQTALVVEISGKRCRLRFQDGKSVWTSLVQGEYAIVKHKRMCGTPGCKLPDWHDGPHSRERRRKRRRDSQPLPSPRRSPRLLPRVFPWDDLSSDLQAAVLLRLANEATELCHQLARVARNLRPWQSAVLSAIALDERLENLLSTTWSASDCKIERVPSSLKGVFWGVHEASTPWIQVQEEMRVNLQLQRPSQTPRIWRWLMRVTVCASHTPIGQDFQLADIDINLPSSTMLGIPQGQGRWRVHRMPENQCRLWGGSNDQMLTCGIGVSRPRVLIFPKLVTLGARKMALRTCGDYIFEWDLPPSTAPVLQLVRALV